MFNGKQLIDASNLIHFENDSAVIINDTKSTEDKKRRRDIVVKTDVNGIYCFLSIEHQSSIDQEMVLRCGIYEMMEYLKQLKNKKLKRLVPQVMIVFYTGPKKWKGPLTLSDYLDIPEELKEYVNDGKIKVVDVKEIDTTIQEMYKGNYEGLHRK